MTSKQYVAYIGTAADVVAGEHMDLTVHDLSLDGPGDAVLTTSTGILLTEDHDEAITAALAILDREGWQLLTDWEYESNALRALVAPPGSSVPAPRCGVS